jgi:hypothetical protein
MLRKSFIGIFSGALKVSTSDRGVQVDLRIPVKPQHGNSAAFYGPGLVVYS